MNVSKDRTELWDRGVCEKETEKEGKKERKDILKY